MISLIILQENILSPCSKDWWEAQIPYGVEKIHVIGYKDAVVGVGFNHQRKRIQRLIESSKIICRPRHLSFHELMNFQIIKTFGTPFQEAVWKTLLTIPWGTVRTYTDIATQMGHPRAVRAVATAVGANLVSILIPCHRVVPKSGGIGQYHWGIPLKSFLLKEEGRTRLKNLLDISDIF